MAEFKPVYPRQKFAGAVLTELGAMEVNGARAKVARGETDPLYIKLAKGLRGTSMKIPLQHFINPDLYNSDKKIFPWIK